MRSKEFIVEKTVGKISQRAQKASVGINTYGDHERMDSTYTAYRMGLAMACANGCDPLVMDYKSWYGKKKTVHPYTPLEQEMFKQAAEAMGADYKDINHGNMASEELETTNTVSPINNWMNKK